MQPYEDRPRYCLTYQSMWYQRFSSSSLPCHNYAHSFSLLTVVVHFLVDSNEQFSALHCICGYTWWWSIPVATGALVDHFTGPFFNAPGASGGARKQVIITLLLGHTLPAIPLKAPFRSFFTDAVFFAISCR